MKSDTAGRVQAEAQEPSRRRELPLEAQEGVWVKPLGAESRTWLRDGVDHGQLWHFRNPTGPQGPRTAHLSGRAGQVRPEGGGVHPSHAAWGSRSLQSSEIWLLPVPFHPGPSQLPEILSFWVLSVALDNSTPIHHLTSALRSVFWSLSQLQSLIHSLTLGE